MTTRKVPLAGTLRRLQMLPHHRRASLDDFDKSFLDETAHRPWPMPRGPWVFTQSWHDLLFAHWRVDAAHLRRLVPAAFELDLYEGDAWLGIVPFYMTNVSLRLMPSIPGLSEFPELNVRTYVTVDERPGVYFFSLDAANAYAVAAARGMLKLPYFRAAMEVSRTDDTVSYDSRRTGDPGAAFAATYSPRGPVTEPATGSLEHFLSERYCLYNVDHLGKGYHLQIHHRPWALQPANATITRNEMARVNRIDLPTDSPLLHYAERQDMVGWPPMWL